MRNDNPGAFLSLVGWLVVRLGTTLMRKSAPVPTCSHLLQIGPAAQHDCSHMCPSFCFFFQTLWRSTHAWTTITCWCNRLSAWPEAASGKSLRLHQRSFFPSCCFMRQKHLQRVALAWMTDCQYPDVSEGFSMIGMDASDICPPRYTYCQQRYISSFSVNLFQSKKSVMSKVKLVLCGQDWYALCCQLSSPLAPFFVHFMSPFLATRAMHFMSPLCTFCHLFKAGQRLAKALSDKAYCCSPW